MNLLNRHILKDLGYNQVIISLFRRNITVERFFIQRKKTSKNDKAYQLIYLLAGEDVVTIINWRNAKVCTDMDVRMLIQEKNNYKTIFKIL